MARKLPEIKKRNDGYYEMKITVSTGVRKSVYGKTEAEVRKKAKLLREDAARLGFLTAPHTRASSRRIYSFALR